MRMQPLTFATLTFCLLSNVVRAQDASLHRPINPALLYWQAAAQLSPTDDKQAAELSEIAAGRLPADPAKIERFHTGTAKELIRKAAWSTAPCDWGLPLEEGPGTNLPHISKLRQLVILAVAEGEVAFAAGQPDQGRDWLLITHRMARHVGVDGSLVGVLLQYGIDDLALRAAARHCLSWDEKSREDYAERLDELPRFQFLPTVYQHDCEIYNDWIERLSRLDGPGRQQAMQAAFPRGGANLATASSKPLNPADWDLSMWQKELASLRTYQSKVTAMIGRPWKECHLEMDALEQAAEKSLFYFYPLVASIPGSLVRKKFNNATLHTMLDLALRCGAQINEAAAATSRDSFEEEPLHLKTAKGGAIVLAATNQHPAGENVELRLGK